MSLTDLTRRLKQAISKPTPKTRVASGGTAKEPFSERKRTAAQLEKYRIVYDQGGIVTEAVNSYPMFATANGWRLEGKNESEKKMVQDWLTDSNFEAVLWDGIVDAIVFGDAFQEIVIGRDRKPAYLMPRMASRFEILHDEFSKVAGYTQKVKVNGEEKTADLKPDQILHLQFWRAAGSVYGHSLIHRAYDEILRDVKVAEASTEAIKRHGYKRYHIKVGIEGETIDDATLKAVDKEFRELDSKNEFVTPHDFEILNIDEGGMEKIGTYNDITIMRLSSAMGVPEEILGLRRGSTDATATKRIETFYKKVTAIQRHIAWCYSTQVIDRLTKTPGSIQLVFNDVDPKGELEKAKWITLVMKASDDPFAIFKKEWVKKQFGIEE